MVRLFYCDGDTRGDNLSASLYNLMTESVMNRTLQCIVGAFVGLTIGCAISSGQTSKRTKSQAAVSDATLLTIIRHEDERRWDDQLKALLSSDDPKVRARAALAAGRIGDDKAVEALADTLLTDQDNAVREMAAFALGEIESPGGAYALVSVVQDPQKPARARAIEALGKVTAAMNAAKPGGQDTPDDDRLDQCKATILSAL